MTGERSNVIGPEAVTHAVGTGHAEDGIELGDHLETLLALIDILGSAARTDGLVAVNKSVKNV